MHELTVTGFAQHLLGPPPIDVKLQRIGAIDPGPKWLGTSRMWAKVHGKKRDLLAGRANREGLMGRR
jgi:hypothetical protein